MMESAPKQPPKQETPEDAYNLDQPENPSRRNFLFNVGAAALISSIPTAGPYLIDEGRKFSGETINREILEKELFSLREKLRNERGVEVDFSPIFPNEDNLSGESLEYIIEKRDVCKALIQSFNMYPPFMHEHTGLSVIRVVNNLKIDGNLSRYSLNNETDIAGLANDEGVMYVEYTEQKSDVINVDSWINDKIDKVFPSPPEDKITELRRITHHELEHFIEKPKPISETNYQKTTRGFAAGDQSGEIDLDYLYHYELDYLSKNNLVPLEDKKRIERRYRGFARKYGRERGYEDRATIVESLLTDPGSCSDLLERAKTDPVLSKKIEFLKNYYFERSYGTMDNTYWDLIQKNDINSETIEAYLKDRAKILSSMSADAYTNHIKSNLRNTVISSNDIVEWKTTLSSWTKESEV